MNYLDHSAYVDTGKTLAVDETVHIEHCKPGKARLYVTRTKNGILAYCHHCRERGFYRMDSLSTAPIERRERTTARTLECTLPSDAEGRAILWPTEPRFWAEQYLTEFEIDESSLCYSESKGGIVFPLFSYGELIGYQVRKFPESDNKYITFRKDNQAAIDPFTSRHVLREPASVVIVEDWISAYKISLHTTLDAIPLCGVNLTSTQFQRIISYPEVTIALDNDNPTVRKAQTDIVRSLSFYTAVRSVLIDKDAKAMSVEELRDVFDPYEW